MKLENITIEELEEKNKELEKQLKVAKKALYFYSDMEHCWETLSMTYAPAHSKDEVIEESENGFYYLEGHYPIENGERARRAIENMEAIKEKKVYRAVSEVRKRMKNMEIGDVIYVPADSCRKVHNYIASERINFKRFKVDKKKTPDDKLIITRLEDYDRNESY